MSDRQRQLSFPFESKKLAETIAFFAFHGVPDLTKLKAAKLVYFADRAHLLRFGRPIVGGHYFCMDKGPVPSEGLDTINAAAGNATSESARELAAKIHFRRAGLQIHPRLVAKNPPNPEVFSESELQVLESVTSEFGRLPVGSLIEMSHAHEAWRKPDTSRASGSRAEMTYEAFFHENPLDAPILEVAKIEQADRDFADAFRRAAARRRVAGSR